MVQWNSRRGERRLRGGWAGDDRRGAALVAYLLQQNHPRHVTAAVMDGLRDLVRGLRRERNHDLADDVVAFLLLEPRLWVYRPLEQQVDFVHHLRMLLSPPDNAVDMVRAFFFFVPRWRAMLSPPLSIRA